MSLQIRRLSYPLGAEIIGIDFTKPLDDETFSKIHSAFLEHLVLLFRGQPLTRAQHIAFTRRFGEVDKNDKVLKGRHPEYPEILVHDPKPIEKRSDPGIHAFPGDTWHSDRSHTSNPSMATVLRGVEVPEVGGDTMFSNTYLAYEALSDGMKKLIEGLHGVDFGGRARIDKSTPERLAETMRLNPRVAQPVVRVHPETGRKALFVSQKIKQLVGMTAEESEPLIQFLCKHAARPQFVYRHRWQKDDLLMWDNRCTNHIALGDYDRTQIRHIEKTTVIGTPSGYVYAPGELGAAAIAGMMRVA